MKSRLVRALLVCAALAAVFAVDTLRAASTTIVISEFRVRGPNGAADEFVELFNGSASAVDISGWKINGSNNAGTASTRATIPANTTLGAGCYYLVTNSSASGGPYSGAAPGNLTFTTGITDDGGIALLTAANAAIDQVGMSTGSAYKEGTTLASLGSSNLNRGYERKPGQDTDDNLADFQLATPSTPQNAAPGCLGGPAPTNPSGTMTASPTSVGIGDSITFTVTVTPGTNPTSTGITVTGNLAPLGLGTPAFTGQGGNVFAFTGTIPNGVSGGAKSVTATITDANTPPRSATTAPATQVTVLSPSNPTISGSANPSSVAPGDTTTLTVTVTPGANPASTGLAVTGNLAAIGGNTVTQFQGSGTTFTFSAIVAQGTTAGPKSLPITVTDAENRSGSFNLPLNVTAANVNSTIVISQVYGGGGNGGATYRRDYVQLYNRGATTVDITGWSLQYASATGTNWTNRQPLGGSIAPGNYYLVALASGGAVGADLPPSQISGEINMSGTTGKIALVDNFDFLTGACPIGDPHIRDFVGYGSSATCHEGAANAPAPSNTAAIIRKGGGFTDTDENGSDFAAGAPAPLQTEPIVELGPLVLSTDPRTNGFNVPRDATIQVSFTEAVDVSPAWFDISCTASGRHDSATFATDGGDRYITPNDNFTAGEQCTVTIFKDHVSDHDSDDAGANTDHLPADYVWSFTVATGTAPVFPASVHLAMGNPSGATTTDPLNYLMEKPEFTLSYNRDRGGPNWVSWHLSEEWIGTLERVDTFRPDPAVPADWYRVQSFDFAGSGFDRGHMVPNADRDKETSSPINQATFLMSNMLAQSPDNNQGPWANLENALRALLPAAAGQPANEIYLVAGGAGTGGAGSAGPATTIANGHVTVPAVTWKVALVIPAGGGDDLSRVSCTTRTIAVVMPNVQGIRNVDWHDYLTTVDAVETLTGYNFFSNLPAPIQRCVEAGTNGNNPPLIKGDQMISFDAPADRTYGDAPFTVSASGGDSGNPVTFAASGACTASGVDGSTISPVSAGTCTVTASQAGSDLYNAAADVVRSFTVSQAAPSFSGLTSATIEAGTAATTFSGTLGVNGLVPPGSVVITVGAGSVNAPIGAGGSFSASVATASLPASAAPYAVTYSYAGSANFNGASGAGTLTVVDTTGPSLANVTATPDALGPPNHKMIDVTIGYTTGDLSGAPACTLSVSSNEDANALGDGNTAIDWQVLDPHHVRLRAERAGGGSGRIYTIAIRCTDRFGNSSTGAAAVSVSK
ncbi:MAG TPA: DNA/RNA non-specific endonuclease [Vicinamibacterales bacterium]|nr:DNA/RNA non-specific endonuclease [Vicinamibacterales bacterium]